MLRTFIAVTLPPDVRQACTGAARRLEAALGPAAAGLRWVRGDGLHVTLKFLGDTPVGEVDALAAALARAAAATPPFPLTLQGLGAFPSPRRPRVVYVGTGAGAAPLGALAARVEAQVAPLGYPTDGRGFRGHVTLARVSAPGAAPRIGEALGRVAAGELACFQVQTVTLMRSDLLPGGARYTPLAELALGAP